MYNLIAVMLFLYLGLLLTPQIWADIDELVLTVNSVSEYKVGQYPSISGLVTDSDGNPVNDVQIQASFPSRTILISTNSLGEFSITSPIPTDPGQYTVIISATKDKLFVDAKITYDVTASKSIIPLLILPQGIESNEPNKFTTGNITQGTKSDVSISMIRGSISNIINSEIQPNPFSNTILPQTELQNEKEIKQKTIDEKSQNIKEQKQKTVEAVSNDLKLLEKKNESNTPKNVFLQFLNDIDSSVKNIFWGQFLFTEKKTDQGLQAKEKALGEGKSSKDAMKSFQKAAATTRNEIIEYNNKLNIEYGNATFNIQEQFDENGKLPREK
ncbi:MAG: uncharacterized protein HW410_775 [Nitrosarchaeum sp.]|nr:uncharacterized protein [Nitrosarchaeum sp.]